MLPRSRSLLRARRPLRRGGVVTVISALALAASLLVAPAAASAVTPRTDIASAAPAVDAGIVQAAAVVGFNPESIISDALFYDGNAMSAAEIQAFLNAKIGTCQNGKCLNVLTTGISSRGAVVSQTTGNLICSAIEGGSMPVSELIYRVQVACGISAKVILTTLQKEQGLTTSTAPSDWNLKAAMGASCPDTAPCDPAFAGVGPQILKGTQQLKTYKAANFAKQPGVNFIGYNPNSACGGTTLNIRNYATAALYNYTPYQPNAAALAAGYGLGDGCSSYGNRNFYNYYTSWFGSTQSDIATARSAITARWAATSGAVGVLGSATGEVICGTRDGGCYQNFQAGAISWTASAGAWETFGGIRARWQSLGYENGVLGYPVGPPTCGMNDGGCYQNFQAGAISWTPATGAWETFGGIRARWQALNFENGVLGYPIGAPVCGMQDGGCYQNFQRGAITWTAAIGAWETYGDIRARWSALSFETGVLGYPVGGVTCGIADGGCYQNFQNGAITWTSSAGAWETYGGIRARWSGSGFETGALRYPTAAPANSANGVYQRFQGGAISWTPTRGPIVLTGAVAQRWLAIGAGESPLKYPTGESVCGTRADGCFQNFENGAISWTASTGAWETYGAIRHQWNASGFENGSLGYPIGGPVVASGGVFQRFENGGIGWSPASGTFASTGAIGRRWIELDGAVGTLGVPIGPITCGTRDGGCYQDFQNGAISSTPASGTWETYGDIRARWRATGFESGVLGYPSSAPTCGTKDGGCYQNFQNGAISWTAATGAWETYGDIRAYWRAQGFERGALGYPIAAPGRDGHGILNQAFQGGVVTLGSGGATTAALSG